MLEHLAMWKLLTAPGMGLALAPEEPTVLAHQQPLVAREGMLGSEDWDMSSVEDTMSGHVQPI